MSTGNIQQSPKKISKSSTTANIKLLQALQISWIRILLEEHLSPHCLLPLKDIYGQPLRQDKLLPHHHVGLVKDAWKIVFPSKQWLVKARVLSKQWSDVQKSHHLWPRTAAKAVYLLYGRPFESSFNTAEWIKNHVYSGLLFRVFATESRSHFERRETVKRFTEVSLDRWRAEL